MSPSAPVLDHQHLDNLQGEVVRHMERTLHGFQQDFFLRLNAAVGQNEVDSQSKRRFAQFGS